MDEITLLETIERYLAGEMTSQEVASFEQLRKNNAEVDQQVVEHTIFLQNLDRHAEIRNFKHNLHEVENKLVTEGIISVPALRGKAKVVFIWNKYKRSMAVAASIAGFISLLTLGLTFNATRKYDNSYQYLVEEIHKTNQKLNNTDKKVDDIKTDLPTASPNVEPKVDYRGTGFLIDGKGYLVTNAHVVNKMKNVYVENNKGEYFKASAIYTDNNVDLVILKIVDTAYKAIASLPYSIRRTNADLGEQCFTLGYPKNEIVYGEGYVSAKSGNDGDSTAYQLTVSANPGNSGGPVLNKSGEIIGIITAKDSKADGVVYAAKSKNIYKLVEQLKKIDEKEQALKTPAGNSLKGLDRVQQVKKLEDYVFMVVGN